MKPTIVVPLDGSENAEQALPYARALAQRSEGSLLLVSVVDIPVEFGAWSMASAGMYGIELDKWQQESHTYLQRIAGEQTGLTVTTMVRIGSAAAEILAATEGAENPVIVTTSHGRTGLSRIFMGSVASKLVRESKCPVLVIRMREQPAAATPAFDRVLVPLDGSPFSEEGLERAVDVFGGGLTLHLLRVVEVPTIPAAGMADGGLALNYGLIDEYMDATRDVAAEYLKEMTEKLTAEGHTVTADVRQGIVADEVLKAAAEHQADVIAMATHGRGGLGRIFLGSVAERVLQEAERPLLLTKPQKR
ncbi:MAG TPA: universal stress protein [Thermomicrobiales bacterium]|nr:universal stress protein [Thermomicrobiales bacterium]